ncbi:DUF5689 domain-containing protein [Rhizosphaericola mali]|uniref:DUF5689 domain-containing protein n=1 Tax=Rhizosphaericola mali TaxID=2545455 RepID=A0A5P2GD34_9BACT|nr:DUF5689 domain-containing protein [Rhizosphaericola mali]QES89501.1 hypothetical protein E0W69_012800 [Rhizosphaericola mali]
MKTIALFAISFILTMFYSCSNKYDIPQLSYDSATATITIMELKHLHTVGKFEYITTNEVISGIITADDKSGNFYQTIILQDHTSGIVLKIGGYNNYSEYPIGRKIYIKLKGLYLGDYGNTIQIGGGIDSSIAYNPQLSSIANPLLDQYILKGSFNNNVIPKLVEPEQLTTELYDSLQSCLIQINNIQFAESDVNKTLADTSKLTSAVSYLLSTCTGQDIQLRNSSYSNFANVKTPARNGTITGIYSIYNTTKQIIIRDTSDLNFQNDRCNQQLADTNRITSIATVKNLYSNKSITIPYGTVIKAKVISNYKNEANGNYKLQDEFGNGIILYSTKIPTIELNANLVLDLGGSTLEMFSNELEITNISADKLYTTSPINTVIKPTNIYQIYDSASKWNNSLVQLSNVTISTPTVSSSGRSYTLMDATGSMETFVKSSAGYNLPQGNILSITGYLTMNAGKIQLVTRTNEDISYQNSTTIIAHNIEVNYTFSNVTTISGTIDPTPAPIVTNLQCGNFRAIGLNSNPSASGRFSFTNWPTGATSASNDFTGVIDLNKYYEVTFTPDQNAQLNLDNFSFSIQRSATGPRQWSVRSSLDNFQNDIASSYVGEKVRIVQGNIFQIADRATNTSISNCILELGSNFQNLNKSISFRFYAFNSETTGGSFSLNNVKISGKIQ